jgi:hypothetical protein
LPNFAGGDSLGRAVDDDRQDTFAWQPRREALDMIDTVLKDGNLGLFAEQ